MAVQLHLHVFLMLHFQMDYIILQAGYFRPMGYLATVQSVLFILISLLAELTSCSVVLGGPERTVFETSVC